VTVACVVDAAHSQHISLAAVVLILAAESGQVGRVVVNKNGTYDMGPGQINSTWLGPLAQRGISESMIRNNGCVNVMATAWIFQQAMVQAKGDVWAAIGVYHSLDGVLALNYQRRVYRLLSSHLNVEEVVARANRSLAPVPG
jgi:Transglycosylase SLT domain